MYDIIRYEACRNGVLRPNLGLLGFEGFSILGVGRLVCIRGAFHLYPPLWNFVDGLFKYFNVRGSKLSLDGGCHMLAYAVANEYSNYPVKTNMFCTLLPLSAIW